MARRPTRRLKTALGHRVAAPYNATLIDRRYSESCRCPLSF